MDALHDYEFHGVWRLCRMCGSLFRPGSAARCVADQHVEYTNLRLAVGQPRGRSLGSEANYEPAWEIGGVLCVDAAPRPAAASVDEPALAKSNKWYLEKSTGQSLPRRAYFRKCRACKLFVSGGTCEKSNGPHDEEEGRCAARVCCDLSTLPMSTATTKGIRALGKEDLVTFGTGHSSCFH